MLSLTLALPGLDAREVFRAHAPYVHRLARHLGVAEADLDDVVQDVFTVVFRRADDYDAGRASLRTWLYGICLGVVRNHRRKAHLRQETVGAPAPPQVSERTPEVDLVTRQRLDRLARALDALDEAKRAVFVLYELEELDMADVAELLGIPKKTAYSRLYAARERVLPKLKEDA